MPRILETRILREGTSMNKAVLLSTMGVLAAVATIGRAEEVGRVISSDPVIEQVQVPRQVCSNDGGQASNSPPQCSIQTFLENRTVAYAVRYEYAGREYNVRMPFDPGPTIRLQVRPVDGNGGTALQSSPGGRVAPPVQVNGDGTPSTATAPLDIAQEPPANAGSGTGQPVAPQYGHPRPMYQNPVTQVPSYLQSPDGYPPSGPVSASTTYYYPYAPYYPYAYGYPYGGYPYYGGYWPYYSGFPIALSFGFGSWGWGGGHGHRGWSGGHRGGGHAIHGGGGGRGGGVGAAGRGGGGGGRAGGGGGGRGGGGRR
jgi:hypothetical protein